MENHIPILINITHISFFLVIIIIATFFPLQSHSQPPSVNDYSTCKDIKNSYSCGSIISNISYPFWGENRPFHCGAGNPYHLYCHNNKDTTILLYSQKFTVLDINIEKHTIKLKRTDLDQNLCSPQYNDTYLFPPLFQYPSTVNNITIFYNCTPSQSKDKISLCGSQNHAFCHVGNQDRLLKEYPELKNCKRHVQVPAGEGFPLWPFYDGIVDIDNLKSGLNNGFEVNYSVKEECAKCLGSEEGDCKLKSNRDIEKHVNSSCYYDNCSDGSIHFSTQQCSNLSMFSISLSHNK